MKARLLQTLFTDQERKLLAIRFDKYIDKAFKTGIKKLIFVITK